MSERKRDWTPGPWFISRDPRPDMEWNNHIASQNTPHHEVCSMFHTMDRDGNIRGEANARLTAAAPELVEALEEAIEWDSHDSEGVPAVWLDKATALLAKIYGDET